MAYLKTDLLRGEVTCPRLTISMAVIIAVDQSGEIKLLSRQCKLKKKSKTCKYQEQWQNRRMFYEL